MVVLVALSAAIYAAVSIPFRAEQEAFLAGWRE